MFVVSTLIVVIVLSFFWSLRDFAIERDNMNFIEESVYRLGYWTDDLKEQYDEARNNIISSRNPLVRACYYHNTTMKVVVAVSAAIMIMAIAIIIYVISFVKRDITRKKRRRCRA